VSELAAALAATDGLLALSVTMHEIAVGPKGPKAAMDVRDGLVMCAYKSSLVIDAMGLLSSVAAAKPKAPAEKSLFPHLLWLRDLLIKRILDSASWTDTRDMGSDGLTKGSIDRAALLAFAAGWLEITQPRHTVQFSQGGSPVIVRARAAKVPEFDESEE
jgi:hypothetical protein